MFCLQFSQTALAGSSPIWIDRPPTLKVCCRLVFYDTDAHITGSTFDLAHCAFNIDRVQVLHLCLGDFAHLGAGDLTYDLAVRFTRTLFDPGSFLQQDGRRRGFEYKFK